MLRKLNVEHLLGAILFREDHRMSYVSVLRPGASGPFGSEEVALLRGSCRIFNARSGFTRGSPGNSASGRR